MKFSDLKVGDKFETEGSYYMLCEEDSVVCLQGDAVGRIYDAVFDLEDCFDEEVEKIVFTGVYAI